MGVMGIDLGTTTISIVMMDADSGAILGSRTVVHLAGWLRKSGYGKR